MSTPLNTGYVPSQEHLRNIIATAYQNVALGEAVDDGTDPKVRNLHKKIAEELCHLAYVTGRISTLNARLKIAQLQCDGHEYVQASRRSPKLRVCRKCLDHSSSATY